MKKNYIFKNARPFLVLFILSVLGTAQTSTAQTGSCLHFDGINDYVNVGNSEILNSLPLTIEAYVKPELRTDEAPFYPNNIISNDIPSFSGMGVGINIDSSGSHVVVEYNDGFLTFDEPSIIAGNWVHVAVVYTETNIKTYINGDLKNDFNYINQGLNYTNSFLIGCHNDDENYSTRRFFKGLIDEVRIWNRAILQEEIVARMNCEIPNSNSTLLANYHFNQGVANANNSTIMTLLDSGGANQNGSLVNFDLNGSTSNWVGNSAFANGTTCPTNTYTYIQPSQCDSTLLTINQPVYASLVSGAQMYRFKVTDVITNQEVTIDRVLRVFNFTQLPSYAYARTYKIEVSARVANVFQPYGSPCFVTTPSPTSQIQESQCGTTLTSFNSTLHADQVQYAAGYRFLFIDNETNEQFIFDRPTRAFRINLLPRVYQTLYSVQVAVKNLDGTYLPYGPICSIRMPLVPVPSIVNCGVITNNQISVTSVSEATLYRFEFVHEYYYTTGWSEFYYQFTSTSPSISLGGYYNPYHTYHVRVRAEINGVLGAFSDFCVVPGNGQGVPDARMNQNFTSSPFEVTAAPNPFSSHLALNINSHSDEAVEVKVYDMLGKLIEQKTYSTLEIEIGENLTTGLYNVIVSQGSQTQTVRIVKR